MSEGKTYPAISDTPCERCESSLVLQPNGFAYVCDGCGATYTGLELERAPDRKAAAQLKRDLADCWRDQTKRRQGSKGGGDKGPKKGVVVDIPDSGRLTEEQVRAMILRAQGARSIVTTLPIETTTDEVRAALHEFAKEQQQ